MSGIYNIWHYVITWKFSNCELGSSTCLFFNRQSTTMNLCEREAEKKDSYEPQEIATQVHFRGHQLFSPSPAGCCPLNFLELINLKI